MNFTLFEHSSLLLGFVWEFKGEGRGGKVKERL